jgi:hypothetical protein
MRPFTRLAVCGAGSRPGRAVPLRRKGKMDSKQILNLAMEALANRRAEIELEIEALHIIRDAEMAASKPARRPRTARKPTRK